MNQALVKKCPLVLENSGSKKIISVGDVSFGGQELIIMAGPCALEDREQVMETAAYLKGMGVKVFRGGAYKPRTSPYGFQGLGIQGLELLAEVREKYGLVTITEIVSEKTLDAAKDMIDVIQIGARNMQNFELLKAVGKTRKPVLLKRGLAATLEEWILAAEYLMSEGNNQVLLCERGIRTFEQVTRNTLDLSVVPILKELTGLPVIVDPSHATGRKELISPMSRAAIAAGADGLIVEVHPNPDVALCDGPQSMDLGEFKDYLKGLEPITHAVQKSLGRE